jgi:hypothetical protein
MASKARKERRRLEREQRAALLTAIADEIEPVAREHGLISEPDDVPTLVEVVRAEPEGPSYEEANWAKLSPTFRDAHNRLRITRGLSPIPQPAIDLYRPPPIRRADPKELEALDREAGAAKAQFLGQQRHMAPGREGFTVNGVEVKF